MMRISGSRAAIVSAVLLALLTGIASVATAEDAARALAARLFDATEYDAALTEYKRFLFFNAGHPETWRIYERIAACYRALGEWPKAAAWYTESARNAPDASGRVDMEIEAAVTEIAAGSFSAAEFRLLSLRSFAPSEALAGRDALFLGVLYVLSDRPEEADRELRTYVALLDEPRRAAIEAVLERSRHAPRRSPRTARLLSTLLPGLGQVYAGDALDGLNSLLVNGASVALIVGAILAERYAEAGLVFSYLFQRYYAGGRSNADKLAIERNEQINRAFATEILEAIE
ncbi:MAG: tetratricopeptide repeat protein [Spirochaetes bacterium]|nr:tetratricopeptide repeat protein [Spirochaetota bacterium]